jgi:ABC-2 type transport system permease protein
MRYSYARLFQSKFLVLFMAVCLFYPLGCAVFIYISHNSPLLIALEFRSGSQPDVDGKFFYAYCVIQGTLAFLLTTLIGPSLIAPDLSNGAMALYLSRPFSRAQYVAGKLTVLLFLLSLITWIPGLLLYLIQVGCVGGTWAWDHLWLAGAIVLGQGVWILVLALIALALSAWVRWKIAAGALILGVFFAGAGFGEAINGVMRTHYGDLINLTGVVQTIWSDLFRHETRADLTVTEAWITLAAVSVLCLTLLSRRIRAFEVVR